MDRAHPGPLDVAVEILDLQSHVREAPILLVLLQVLQDVIAPHVHPHVYQQAQMPVCGPASANTGTGETGSEYSRVLVLDN